MEFTTKDCQDMFWNVLEVDMISCDVPEQFPIMKHYSDFAIFYYKQRKDFARDIEYTSMTAGQLLYYVCLTYDPKSPYVTKYIDINKRKTVILEQMEMVRKVDGRFNDHIENVRRCKNQLVNMAVLRFLRLLKDADWQSFISYLELKAQVEGNLINAAIDVKDKKESLNMSKSIRVEIAALEKSFLTGDQNPNLVRDFYDSIEDEEIPTPEAIALKLFMKERPKEFNPYKNPLPVEDYMRLVKEGKSPHHWDNEELVYEKVHKGKQAEE